MENLRLSECIAEYPNEVLDAVRKQLHLKNDAALSRILGISPSTISNIRHGKIPLRSVILVRMLESTQLHIRDLFNLSQGIAPKRRKTEAPAATARKSTGTTRPC